MKCLLAKVLAGGLLMMVVASIAGCYPYWRYRDYDYNRRDGYRDRNHG